jgi:hypothetical protein
MQIMKTMHKFITILLIGLSSMAAVWGQTVPTELLTSIGKGDAVRMAEFFHESLEMSILEKDYIASKNQAARIMESFFREHPPTGFAISFEGAKENSKYAIGSLTTAGGNFRVNMYFLSKDGQRLIYYLSIEKEAAYELPPGS